MTARERDPRSVARRAKKSVEDSYSAAIVGVRYRFA